MILVLINFGYVAIASCAWKLEEWTSLKTSHRYFLNILIYYHFFYERGILGCYHFYHDY